MESPSKWRSAAHQLASLIHTQTYLHLHAVSATTQQPPGSSSMATLNTTVPHSLTSRQQLRSVELFHHIPFIFQNLRF